MNCHTVLQLSAVIVFLAQVSIFLLFTFSGSVEVEAFLPFCGVLWSVSVGLLLVGLLMGGLVFSVLLLNDLFCLAGYLYCCLGRVVSTKLVPVRCLSVSELQGSRLLFNRLRKDAWLGKGIQGYKNARNGNSNVTQS